MSTGCYPTCRETCGICGAADGDDGLLDHGSVLGQRLQRIGSNDRGLEAVSPAQLPACGAPWRPGTGHEARGGQASWPHSARLWHAARRDSRRSESHQGVLPTGRQQIPHEYVSKAGRTSNLVDARRGRTQALAVSGLQAPNQTAHCELTDSRFRKRADFGAELLRTAAARSPEVSSEICRAFDGWIAELERCVER